jgi:hypothetical protein
MMFQMAEPAVLRLMFKEIFMPIAPNLYAAPHQH